LTPIVALEDVHYAYPPLSSGGTSPAVLKGVSLSLAEGECLALLGPTGAGKSTLCLTLNGIVPQLTGGTFRGHVRVAGRDAVESGPGELSRTVGLVFQDPESQFFNMTVEDEVAFGPESLALPVDEVEARVSEALAMTGADGLRRRSPLELSGGEKQRVALAAVLAMRPQVLVLDEPTASLDPLGKRSLLEAVDRLRAEWGTTVLWATQDVDRLPLLADRVVVLDEGRIALEGGLREVLSQHERLRTVGVGVPQMTELAACLNAPGDADYGWMTVEEAARDLQHSDFGALENDVTSRDSTLHPRQDPPADDATRLPRSEIVIELESCTYTYNSGHAALHGVSCSIEAGNWVALIGQNGSGKTTLAKLCNGLLRPQEGRVRIRGRDVRGRPVGEVARDVGYLFQNPDHQIFASTVREEVAFGLRNLGFPQGEVERRTGEALAAFELTEHADRPPAVLGHGLRRQVTLASLLARRPPILILDEPTAGLDSRRTQRLLDRLDERRAAGATVLFITHDVRLVAEWATHVLLLHCGELLAQGPTRKILSQPDLLARAFVSPPPITRLSQALQPQGLRGNSLTVDGFCREYLALLAVRGGEG
jgi:energy-coupling factor transport system ATP-binding protein